MKKFRGNINVLYMKQATALRSMAGILLLSTCCAVAPLTLNMAHAATPAQSTATAVTPESILGAATQNPAQAAQQLMQANPAISGSQASGIINNLLTNGVSAETAKQILGNVIGNQINAALGQALSGLPNVGNITNPSQLANALGSSLLSGLTGGGAGAATSAVQQATNALNIAGGGNIQQQLQNALAQGAANVVSDMLSKAFPELAKALGGPAGIQGIVAGLLGSGNLSISASGGKDPSPGGASCNCEGDITAHHETIRAHMTNKRKEHEVWLVTEFFTRHVAPALMLMAEQLTVAGMQQVQIIGTFFDAKHQLETQRLLQQMTAQAHKDYQPSEGLCTFGTGVRSLAASERAGDMAQAAVAARGMQRQLLSGEAVSGVSGDQKAIDRAGRLNTFISTFCNKNDNNKTLDELCKDTKAKPEQQNKDIDYTRSVENKLTLELDFHTPGNDNPSDDEKNIFALGANLYAHDVMPYIDANQLGPRGEDKQFDSEKHLMDIRALAAKRSVAQNSFAAITGMKASGTGDAQPYLYKMVEELGVPQDDLEKLLGKNPSYFAQMEILTKKALQNPVFYTELYDKPVNVDRKGAVLQAIGLMQDRDIYKSLIRSEAILSVLLETQLAPEQDRVSGAMQTLNKSNGGGRAGQ